MKIQASIRVPVAAFASLILWLLSTSASLAADAQPLVLEHLSTPEGLPQATVMTTLQDSQGFVWLGTEDGLVRYDGHQLVRYAHSRTDPHSLPGNFVWQIVEDANRDLWIALQDRGLARWSRAADRFTVYRHSDDPNSLASDSVRTIAIDGAGHIWIGTTDAGIDMLDPQTGRIEHFRHDPQNPRSLGSDRIFSLSLAKSGDLWVGTDHGVDRLRIAQRTFESFGGREVLRDAEITQVLEDTSGSVWVGSYNRGLVRFAADGRLLGAFKHEEQRNDSLANDDVRALLEDRGGRLWVGTADGLSLLDRASGRFTHFRHEADDPDSLRDSFVMSLYQDPSRLVWIGTRSGGVSRWNPRSWEFGGHRPKWFGSSAVTAFAEAANGRVWIASRDGALVEFDPRTGEARTIEQVVGRRKPLGDTVVMSLRQDHLGNLWIGTMSEGVKKLTSAGRLESIPVAVGGPAATSSAGIMTIVESRAGQIWIGTFGGGANVLDPATGMVRQLPFGAAPGAISGENVTAVAEDSRGNVWIGTHGGGLNLAHADGTVVKSFKHDPQDPASFSSNAIYSIAIDREDRVWIGTEGGGFVQAIGSPAAPQSIRFEAMTRAEGLTSDTLYGVVPDDAGHLWLSGNAGLMRFDPRTRVVKAFHREHGLQGEEFQSGAFLRLSDGRLCFGGPGGFNIFDPAKLSSERQAPRLALTSIDVLGARMPSAKPFWLLDRVPLKYGASIVSLDFGILDFSSTRHNRLAYRMQDLTKDWIEVGDQQRVTLTNLSAGDHVLEVRAAGSDSDWSAPMKIEIHRDPAPWQSWWAYCTYALLIVGFIVYRIRRQRLKLREVTHAKERLEAEVQLRTRELVDSNRQLAEAARAKSDFLDRMSHELRTPMNGVVGMTELLSRTVLSATQTHLTKTIRSSAQILLQIVNDLLDLSKIRAGKVALEALPIDLGQVLEECTSLFAGAAESRGIELIVCPPAQQDRTLLGDPLRVRQILMNLVGNAVKFTSKGEVVVRADVEIGADGAVATLAVSDTGVGMDAQAMQRIFEPFAQADETTTRKFGGTGLGLSICRELSDLMGGRISVESQPQIGSTFTLKLPLRVAAVASPAATLPLAGKRIQILSRRPSLQESLQRHAATLGLVRDDASPDVVIVDASSQLEELRAMLLRPQQNGAAVVIATADEVVRHDLRVLLEEKRIVLKPVHRIALREALGSALGIRLADDSTSTSANAPSVQLRGHVLLVEDDAVNAAVAEGYLASIGCTSAWAKTGADAIARFAGERFDLVLMDLNMPDMDGFTATRLIRQREGKSRRIPIVALTAHEASNYREKCLAADMDDILSKPYTYDDCAHLLRKWLVGSATSAPPAQSRDAAEPEAPDSLLSIDVTTIGSLRKLRANGHADLYSKLVGLFTKGSTDAVAQLRAALEVDDFKSAAATCHKLASSASNVGAAAYGRQVRRLEQACIAADRDAVARLSAGLFASHPQLLDALQAMSLKASA